MSINLADVISLSDFAKKVNIGVQTIQKWLTVAEIKPVGKFGVTNVYLVSDLEKLVADNSTNAGALRAIGYVHPDQHKAIVDHRDRLIQVTIDRDAEILDLQANLNGALTELENLRARDAFLSRLEAAGVDNWSGYDTATGSDDDDEDNSTYLISAE